MSPDARRAFPLLDDTTLKVWDLENGGELRTLAGHSDWVTGVAVSPDGRRAVSASDDKTLKVWDLETGGDCARSPATRIRSLAWRSVRTDGVQSPLLGTARSRCGIWKPEANCARSLATRIRSLAWRSVRTDGVPSPLPGDRTLKVWDLETGGELRTLAGHSDSVTGVAVSPDGRRAVSASWDSTLKVWDLETGGELSTLAGHSDRVNGVAVESGRRRAVSASHDNTLKVWDLETGANIATFSCDSAARCGAFADDYTIIAGDNGGRVYFLTLELPQQG